MQFQIVSDIHLEIYGPDWIAEIEPAAENLILAGDICSATDQVMLDIVFSKFSKRWKNIIFTSGNHEHYHNSLLLGWNNIKAVASGYPNFHALNNEGFELEGVKIYGGTGWHKKPIDSTLDKFISDSHYIKDWVPSIYHSRDEFLIKLKEFGQPDVVVTHHLPTDACVDRRFKNSLMNRFFVADFDVEGINPKLWIFGHTHCGVDIKIGNTRLVANPKGYPKEKDYWDNKFVVTI